jgi:hypothetical protein
MASSVESLEKLDEEEPDATWALGYDIVGEVQRLKWSPEK